MVRLNTWKEYAKTNTTSPPPKQKKGGGEERDSKQEKTRKGQHKMKAMLVDTGPKNVKSLNVSLVY